MNVSNTPTIPTEKTVYYAPNFERIETPGNVEELCYIQGSDGLAATLPIFLVRGNGVGAMR